MNNPITQRWQFWIDRGGTFTDIVAQRTDGKIIVHKLLSSNPERYTDAAIQGIRDILGIASDAPIPLLQIAVVKMGTTVATNALLERQGSRTLLLITKGFRDALRIGYQNRPNIFARHIVLPEMLYERVIEVEERYSAQGEELLSVQINPQLMQSLQSAYDAGIRACAIAFLHGYRYPNHEQQIAAIARDIGFTQISVSHEVSPLMKLVSRGDTTVVDAYLSPILRRYVDQVATELQAPIDSAAPQLMFMQSNGGLIDANRFQGKDSILSGPAGGIVGAVKTSAMAGFDKIIGFDMGGTSTDVSHYNGEYERTFETEVAGVRLRAPMMSIHTIAAGGGSILFFDGSRYRVGPESAGAYPGPAAYRRLGSLTVTDCNVMVGKLQAAFFPSVFGTEGNLPLDTEIVRQKFTELSAEIGEKTGFSQQPEQVAEGFLAIAINKMANAIKKISIQRGYDITEYTLCCFGGAGGQHACLIAEALGMTRIFIHPYAGVLSAYGIGLADVRTLKQKAVEVQLTESEIPSLQQILTTLGIEGRSEIVQQGIAESQIDVLHKAHLRYAGTDSALVVDFGDVVSMRESFSQSYHQRYGFTMDKALIVEAVSVEVVGRTINFEEPILTSSRTTPLEAIATVQIYTKGKWHHAQVYQREDLKSGDRITGTALIIEPTGTNIIEPGWCAELTERNHLILSRGSRGEREWGREGVGERGSGGDNSTQVPNSVAPNPVLLEIFNNLVRASAESMGVTLQNTSYSVNIKERLDFSCAIFDLHGQLVANAPHIPVHLGSMSESVASLIQAKGNTIKPGDAYVSNNPYNGGTHLPDVTVITPVFTSQAVTPLFYVASRGHHADIGGITPGSMPPHSTTINQEGILLDNFQLVEQGRFKEVELRELLTAGNYPVRNPKQNLADLQAQIAANERGVQELCRMVEHYGLATVQAYMQHVQDNAEESVRRVIDVLQDGRFTYTMDDGSEIKVKITINHRSRSAQIDFTGTSPQQSTNLNAPRAICKAVVLYVFRTLVDDDIPLNAGCLKPLEIIIPEGCLLNPQYPAAVVAGNVETSQAIANALYGALGIMAASCGTMNNFTFGNDQYQYYETICGGSGAGATFNGTDAVQTHMTNSRLTDPEVLEWRFPVLVEEFAIRPNSGGSGKHKGGNGVIRRIKFRETMTAAILSGHRILPPFGLNGGEPGAIGRNWVEHCDGIEPLPSKAEVQMHPGDVFVIETPGGGGFG
ncbi:hydantoinase B/oxoprolinase family protein [Iningainema tapete]|uniref:Hydantoinase B/oxoprolinase family protein n=2 Tax=Iningainema TaxID=1932705 RepID=A0A8J6XUL5_9CYAN|nr:hydantoinase B/oxoprolinase family protein [Iningainema tapete BLCC-T55]